MALTVTEREHWRNRIAKRIDKAIEAVYASEDPGLLQRVEAKAKQEAARLLGVDSLMEKRMEISREIKRLKREDLLVVRQMVATIRDCDIEEVVIETYYSQVPPEVASAVTRRAVIREEELLSEHKLGKQILSLRLEKEELLDTVWLASSGRQIKELWTSVIERLAQKPTDLQSDALRISPEESESR